MKVMFVFYCSPRVPSAPQQIQKCAQKSTPHPQGNPFLLRSKEQDIPLSTLKTSILSDFFFKLLKTWLEMVFPHIHMTIHHPPVMPGEPCLFSAEHSAGAHTSSRKHGKVLERAGAEEMCSQGTKQNLHTTSVLSAAPGQTTTSLCLFEGIWLE